MNSVENIEMLIKKYFNEGVAIRDKTVSNNCIGALTNENNFEVFKSNFEERLKRIADKVTDTSQRKEIVEKIKNIAEKTGYKWSGPYSELVALDFFLSCGCLDNPRFINLFDISQYPNSLAARNKRKTIDIDFSFELSPLGKKPMRSNGFNNHPLCG